MRWLDISTKDDCNAMCTILGRKQWKFEHYFNFFRTKTIGISEIALYVISRIIRELIAVLLIDADMWNSAVNYMLAESEILFAYARDCKFIPIARLTDSDLENQSDHQDEEGMLICTHICYHICNHINYHM